MEIIKENKPVLNKASFMTRLTAFLIDFGLTIFLASFAAGFGYSLYTQNSSEAKEVIAAHELHNQSSHLGHKVDDQFVTYTDAEYFEKTVNGNYLIIESLSYFYTVYMTGDTSKTAPGDTVSEFANELITLEDGTTVLPKDYYTVSWFNENVLSLPKAGIIQTLDYFEYQKDINGDPIYTEIGTVNQKYIKDKEIEENGVTTTVQVVEATSEMIKYIYEKYVAAVNTLNTLPNIISYSTTLINANALITYLVRTVLIAIFFIGFPLMLKKGKTLGKLLMKCSLVRPDGEPIKKWQVIPRGIIITLIPSLLYFVHILLVQVIVLLLLIIASIVLYRTIENNRVIHDLISNTVVNEDAPKDR
jgi:uncharacterized RDD family membrane protein YckC